MKMKEGRDFAKEEDIMRRYETQREKEGRDNGEGKRIEEGKIKEGRDFKRKEDVMQSREGEDKGRREIKEEEGI